MKPSNDKFHLLVLGHKYENVWVKMRYEKILENAKQKLVGMEIGRNNFDDHVFSICTAQKMKFSIKDFFSKCDQIRSFLRIWPHLLRKSLMENFFFCAAM